MRVLHVVSSFDSTLGYAEYYLAKKQLELGLDVKVICTNYQAQRSFIRSSFVIEDNIPVVRIGNAGFLHESVLLFSPVKLTKVIRDFSPEVIHCHGLLSPLSQAILLQKAHSYILVGDLITGISPLVSRFLPAFKSFFNLWISSRVEAFFACCEAVEEFLLKDMGILSSKVRFIPLGADTELFKPNKGERERKRKTLGASEDDVVAIYSGKFLPEKRIHDLLVASKPVIEQYGTFKLLLVGDGPESYKDQLKFLTKRLEIDDNVMTVKMVHRTGLPSFYNAADFAVWPGTFSISIIEAMACGLPIVITQSKWTKHYFERMTGFSFKEGDVNQLSQLLSKLVSDPKLRKSMAKESRRLVDDKLNWDCINQQYLAVYNSCLGKCQYD